jgi:hypothetical protein
MMGSLRREHDRIVAGTQDLPYVKRSGDTMTGNLTVNGLAGVFLQATQLQATSNGLQVYNASGGQVISRGPQCGYTLGDQNQTSSDWAWYVNAGIARLAVVGVGDRFTITSAGNVAITGSVNASLYGIDNLPVIDSGGGSIHIYDATGNTALDLGADNFYYANTHNFRDNAGATGGLINCWDLTSGGTISGQYINASANVSVGGSLTAANLTVTSTVTGAYVTSTGDVHANNAVTAPSITATGTVQGNFLNSTGSANVAGNLTVGNDSKANNFYLANKLFANCPGGTDFVVYDGAQQATLILSGSGSYYRNGSHTFQLEDGSTKLTVDAAGNLNVPAGSCTIAGNCTAANFYGNFSGGGSTSINTGTISASSNITASGTVTGNSMVCGSGVFQNTGPSNLIGQTSFGPSGSWARIDASGTYNVSGSWLTFSDRAVKTGVTPYTAGLDAINQLEPVSYTYTSAVEQTNITRYGLIADDVAPVLPEMVGSGVTPGGETLATLAPGHLTWVMLNAIKELSAKVSSLEAQLAAAGGV